MSTKPNEAKEPEVGDRMEDGTIFAGVSPDTGENMFVTPKDAPRKMNWDDAKSYAAGLDVYGHTDWRLLTDFELKMLFNSHSAIGSFDGDAFSLGQYYWSGTSYNNGYAWYRSFCAGAEGIAYKDRLLSVRCVRMDKQLT